ERLDDRGEYYWVAREDEEAWLRDGGYANVKAIGLPITYLPHKEVPRAPGSLLVMPPHTGGDSVSAWDFDAYAEEVAALRPQFAHIAVSVSPSCWDRGYWADAFMRRGIEVFKGAESLDRNCLERLRTILSSFEYVTTCHFGSQVAYAAYFGAKVSLYGKYA